MADLRYALRALIKAPGPTAVVVLTLSVAIGAATIVYSTIDLVWHLLPIFDRDRLVFIPSVDQRRGEAMRLGLSTPDLADLSTQSKTLEAIAGFSLGSASLTGVDVPSRVSLLRVTANLPAMWGLRPAAGRLFIADDGRIGAQRVTVLTDTFWKTRFAGRREILGRSVLLNGESHTVIGVLGPEAEVGFFRQSDLLVTLPPDATGAARDERDVLVTGRLAQGISRDEARAEVDAIAARLRSAYPETNGQVRLQVLPLIEISGFNIRTLLFLLGLVAALIVAIACANVTNVVLAQATTKLHESAIRAALGATRLQQVRQTLLESIAMGAAAGTVGMVLGAWGLRGLRWIAGPNSLGFSDLQIGWRVLGASALTAALSAAGVGLLPAPRQRRLDVQQLKEGGRVGAVGVAGRRLRNMLVASQVALAMILMVQIVLNVRAGMELGAMRIGFDPHEVLTLRIELPTAPYTTPDASRQFFAALLDRVRALPGVASAGTIDRLPVADSEVQLPFAIEGSPAQRPEERPLIARAAITPGFITAMRIPLLAGRDFTAADLSPAAPVALINEEAARRYWPGTDPIGKRLTFAAPGTTTSFVAIVGIVGNVRNSDVDQLRLPQVYVPSTIDPQRAAAVVIRAIHGSNPLQLVEPVRRQVTAIDPNQPIHDVATMEQVVADDLSGAHVLGALLGSIGFVALCLAATGIYGVVAYAVMQRRRELAVRIALGASPGRVRRMVLSQGTRPIAIGAVLGLPVAIALGSLTAGAVSSVAVLDPLNYVGVITAIGLVSLSALYVPAVRASRVDPMVALRAE